MNKKISISIFVAVVFIAGLLFWLRWSPTEVDAKQLAECLANKGVVMYGAEWCPHCQKEKNRFGEYFSQISYVECPQNPDKCLSVGIQVYPTWVLPDGKKLEGEQGLEKLAKENGCFLNNQ